jgi:signal transduction histidine kinase
VLGRSLTSLRDIVDSTLGDIRLAANVERRERILLTTFLNDIGIAGSLQAECRGLQFIMEPVDPKLAIDIDVQLLTSAVMNLLNNAFKFTRPGGRISLRALLEDGRVLIEVQDECGGIPEHQGDPFQPFAEQRGKDRTGLGLGLSIARKAIQAHGGDITIRNTPGRGCVFVIEIPLAPTGGSPSPPS